MLKALCFSLPSVSVDNTLIPFSEKLAYEGYEIVFYNYESSPSCHVKFKRYPDSNRFDTNNVRPDMSYFQYANMLLETSVALMPFLRNEVEREKPDFIIHSHLAMWGKMIAAHCKKPAITIFTTFVLDKRIMLPFMRSQKKGVQGDTRNNIDDVLNFQRRCYRLLNDLGLGDKPDIWDAYVNKEDLNLAFILQDFQPDRHLFDTSYKFIGFPIRTRQKREEQHLIYVSMGTIFNKDASIYHLLISVMRGKKMPCMMSLGHHVNKEDLGQIPDNVTVASHVDQLAMLNRAMLFITRGGMASVQEAVYYGVPMIVIPEIPEQRMTAYRIEQLGIGIHLPPEDLSESSLVGAIQRITNNPSLYRTNIDLILREADSTPAADLAVSQVHHYLEEKLFQNKVMDANY